MDYPNNNYFPIRKKIILRVRWVRFVFTFNALAIAIVPSMPILLQPNIILNSKNNKSITMQEKDPEYN